MCLEPNTVALAQNENNYGLRRYAGIQHLNLHHSLGDPRIGGNTNPKLQTVSVSDPEWQAIALGMASYLKHQCLPFLFHWGPKIILSFSECGSRCRRRCGTRYYDYLPPTRKQERQLVMVLFFFMINIP